MHAEHEQQMWGVCIDKHSACWIQMRDLSKQPDALCLVDQMHHHKLDYRHINHFQVHLSDHHAMYIAACCSHLGCCWCSRASGFWHSSRKSHMHNQFVTRPLRNLEESNRNIKWEQRERYTQKLRASGKVIISALLPSSHMHTPAESRADPPSQRMASTLAGI